MNEAEALLVDLLSRGVEVRSDGGRVRWRPAFMVTAPQARRIRSLSAELSALLSHPDRLPRCGSCGWTLDASRRCPQCFDRECVDCGRTTGSYFILRCLRCGNAFADSPATGEDYPG